MSQMNMCQWHQVSNDIRNVLLKLKNKKKIKSVIGPHLRKSWCEESKLVIILGNLSSC